MMQRVTESFRCASNHWGMSNRAGRGRWPARQTDEDTVDNVVEVSDSSVNRVTGWRFVKFIVVPDQRRLSTSQSFRSSLI